jgi:cytidine deaminase
VKGADVDLATVMDVAREAANSAYAPYSNFRVGAAILTEGGALHAGCNVENASYGLGICAERSAAVTMALADPEDRGIRLVAVASPNAAPCFPCGACRQFLREFGCKEVVVEDPSESSGVRRYPFEELLPHSFGPEVL